MTNLPGEGHPVQLFDTYSKQLVALPPPPARVGMYFCGPTVYARAHIGNARPFVLGMWMRRWLRHRGYDATLVHNITDVNDKIYDAAPAASAALADQATAWYLEDIGSFGLGMPDHLPRVTELVPEIICFISKLVDAGFAYAADGDVYFRVKRFCDYGRLSGQRVGQVEERQPNPHKEDPTDFALWKAIKAGEDTWWPSPWGRGRPGWHIECSAMAEHLLGEGFEIHGGGLDLVFPHHENELAQSRALGHPFARIWTHNGMVRFTGEKMSKSLGNTSTIAEMLDEWGREALLVFFMAGHWRNSIEFSHATVAQAAAQAQTLRNAFALESASVQHARWENLAAALDDNFDTPRALAVLHHWASSRQLALLRRGLDLFGLSSLAQQQAAPHELVALADQRALARKEGHFARADDLRRKIDGAGWQVRDNGDGGYTLVPKR